MDRVLEINVNHMTGRLVGDPHVGREFRTGVPLHRRGDREDSIKQSLSSATCFGGDFVVLVGDVFDKFVVSNADVIWLSELLVGRCSQYPNTKFFVLRGNHDASRDVDKVSSFEMLKRLVQGVTSNVIFVDNDPYEWNGIVFFPWCPFETALEVVERGPDSFEVAIGHWDLGSFGGDDSNVIPYDALSRRCTRVYTGHVHSPSEFQHGPLRVTVVGSLQPYSHAEDPQGDRYITLRLDELDEHDVRNKCVRIDLAEGEEVPVDLDCLALQTRPLKADEEAEEVTLGEFNMLQILTECLTEAGVPDKIQKEVFDRYA